MKVLSELTYREYRERFKEALDSPFALGSERFTGWMFFGLFTLNYYSGHEFLRRYYAISNKAMGFVRKKDGKAEITFFRFMGITDPVSFLLIYLACMAILGYAGVHIRIAWWLSLLWYGTFALFTFLFTALSERGCEGHKLLKIFIEHPGRRYY